MPLRTTEDSAATVASSQPLPPTTLLDVWAKTTACSRMVENCLAPRARSSARSTPLLSARHAAHGVGADTRAACTDTPVGAIAHHSASGTASLPTMNSPMRARQPQLSSCVTVMPFREEAAARVPVMKESAQPPHPTSPPSGGEEHDS